MMLLSDNPIHWTNMMSETERNELVATPEFREWLIGVLADDNTSTVITFTKKDGTERVMKCTLNPEQLPKVELKEDAKPRKESTTSMRVFDLDKNDWRSFTIKSVKNVTITL